MGARQVLIFFQMTKVMDIMEDFMKWIGWEYLRLDGGTKTDEPVDHVKRWNTPNLPLKVFILSTRASGLDLNLQTADTVIMYVRVAPATLPGNIFRCRSGRNLTWNIGGGFGRQLQLMRCAYLLR